MNRFTLGTSRKIDEVLCESMCLERSFVYSLALVSNKEIRSTAKLIRVLRDPENKISSLNFIKPFLNDHIPEKVGYMVSSRKHD